MMHDENQSIGSSKFILGEIAVVRFDKQYFYCKLLIKDV